MQGSREPFAEVAALDVEDGRHADRKRRSDSIRRPAAVQEQQDTGAGLDSGGGFAALRESCQRAEFLVG